LLVARRAPAPSYPAKARTAGYVAPGLFAWSGSPLGIGFKQLFGRTGLHAIRGIATLSSPRGLTNLGQLTGCGQPLEPEHALYLKLRWRSAVI
jgi:hypothetical protein